MCVVVVVTVVSCGKVWLQCNTSIITHECGRGQFAWLEQQLRTAGVAPTDMSFAEFDKGHTPIGNHVRRAMYLRLLSMTGQKTFF